MLFFDLLYFILLITLGANIGFFSVFAELEFESVDALKIIAIEPLQMNFNLLKKNLSKYCPSAVLVQAAISNFRESKRKKESQEIIKYSKRKKEDKCKVFNISNKSTIGTMEEEKLLSPTLIPMTYFPRMPGNSCISSYLNQKLNERNIGEKSNNFHADMKEEICFGKTLSSVIDEYNNNNERISLLKIDVEGSELDVLLSLNDHHWELIDQIVLETVRPKRISSDTSHSTSLSLSHSTSYSTSSFNSSGTPLNFARIYDPKSHSSVGSPTIDRMISTVVPSQDIIVTMVEETMIKENSQDYDDDDDKNNEDNCLFNSICLLLDNRRFKVHVDWIPDLGCDSVVLIYATRK